ncbi:MAG TPA: hypothetical protein VN840_20610 [Streptosporangiaceae bacterium]|nr:hypothetical protein [Streptosporangiaceae bacterium]
MGGFLRGSVLAVILAACVIAGISSYLATANSGAHADVIIGAAGSRSPSSARPPRPAQSREPHGRAPGAAGAARTGAARAGAARPSPSAAPVARVAGSSVTAVGDSVMVASTPALEQALPGIYVDAQVGRQFYTGLQVIAALRDRGLLRRIVVVGLGTNGTVTPAEISQLFAEIGPHRRLVLINTFEARSWEQEVNSTLAAAARDHPNVVLADWFTTIEHRTYLLWSDGIHPQPAGGVVYARMLRAAIDRVGSLPQPASGSPRIH